MTDRAKILIWGESGTGKTEFGLALGALLSGPTVVVDVEGGCNAYREDYRFRGMANDYEGPWSTECDPLAVEQFFLKLDKDPSVVQGGLVMIDPFSVLYSEMQIRADTFKRTKKTGANPYEVVLSYDNWAAIKRIRMNILSIIRRLPCHSVVTMRAKTNEDGVGVVMEKPDIKYDFDLSFRARWAGGKFYYECDKTRKFYEKRGITMGSRYEGWLHTHLVKMVPELLETEKQEA